MSNTGRFVIIGFGSLLWDLDVLKPHVAGKWDYYNGPNLPLEFSLISEKRRQALALVIDGEHGMECPTSVIISKRIHLSEVVIDLAEREKTLTENIGFYRSDSNLGHSRSTSIIERIRNWLEPNPWLGVAWTDSVSNFKCKTDIEFSVPAALQYLRSLPEKSLIEAKRYVENAPSRVDTQLRRALVEESWWKDI